MITYDTCTSKILNVVALHALQSKAKWEGNDNPSRPILAIHNTSKLCSSNCITCSS